MVASQDQLDSNLVYFFCNPTGVLPWFLFCNLLFVILYLFVFLPVKSINEMKKLKQHVPSIAHARCGERGCSRSCFAEQPRLSHAFV